MPSAYPPTDPPVAALSAGPSRPAAVSFTPLAEGSSTPPARTSPGFDVRRAPPAARSSAAPTRSTPPAPSRTTKRTSDRSTFQRAAATARSFSCIFAAARSTAPPPLTMERLANVPEP